jgi:predicted O-methyltransferase YrrM
MRSYKSIQGWFDFEDVYLRAVLSNKDGANFLEIGTWLGKSTVFLGSLIKALGKEIQVYAVDTFKGEESCEFHVETVKAHGGSIYNQFRANLDEFGLNGIVNPIVSKSMECLPLISAKEFDFIFLDGGHSYEDVSAEIPYFWPVLKKGGVIGGHDFNQEPVRRAVTEFVQKHNIKDVGVNNISWIIQKN